MLLSLLSEPLVSFLENDQLFALIVLVGAFSAFLVGKWRYDFVALGALFSLVLLGIVPEKAAFLGFSHPAVVTVASVLVLSYALGNTGVTYHLSKHLSRFSTKPALMVLTLSGLVAFFSAFMNDVGALALIMPVAIQVSQRYKIPPSRILMPMAFASLLGGTVTLIGTPPNMIVAQYRASIGLGAYNMFDFTPVGLVVVIVGLAYIALLGWRLIPVRKSEENIELFATDNYLLEAKVEEGNKFIDKRIAALEKVTEENVYVVAILRGSRRILAPSSEEVLKLNDVLLLEGQPDELKQLELLTGLNLTQGPIDTNHYVPEDLEVLEVVINPGARIAERSLAELQLRERYDINVLGVARHGEKIRQRFSRIVLKSGDVLLIQGSRKELPETLNALGCLPLAERNIRLKASSRMLPTIVIFILSILLVAFQILPPQISFPVAVFFLVLFKLLPLRDIYNSQEGPLIVLLGCFITVGAALEKTGVTAILANHFVALLEGSPDIIMVGAVMLVTMLITDVINSSATAVIMAPIAYGVSQHLGHNPDAYLMAVAIGSSCAFNTPIGHHSNTLVMGPGGYYFGDYWRMGLLLDGLLLITVVPTLVFVWPLS